MVRGRLQAVARDRAIRSTGSGHFDTVGRMLDSAITDYYNHGLEQARLSGGARRIEFLRMSDLLSRHLPAPPGVILDVGGGTGVYALPLAAQGYQVHLIDPVPLHVQQAAAAAAAAGISLASAVVGDARTLTAPGASADAVLMLGPLYHLPDPADRLTALAEAWRVLRPGGALIACALSRLYPVFEDLVSGSATTVGEQAAFLAGGRYENPAGDFALFTTSYFHRPDELADEVRAAGFALRSLCGASGCLKLLFPDLGELLDNPDTAARLLAILRLVESEPSILGLSQNIVAIADKPEDRS